MQIILNDSSCLIDLRKVGLLRKMLDLPFRMAVVYPLRASELMSIPEQEWALLEAAGLEVIDVVGELVREAAQLKSQMHGPSFIDCLCLVQTQAFGTQAILLTNDRRLRELALALGTEVHGSLWLVDQLVQHQIIAHRECVAILKAWQSDPLVFLPIAELQRRLEAYENMLNH